MRCFFSKQWLRNQELCIFCCWHLPISPEEGARTRGKYRWLGKYPTTCLKRHITSTLFPLNCWVTCPIPKIKGLETIVPDCAITLYCGSGKGTYMVGGSHLWNRKQGEGELKSEPLSSNLFCEIKTQTQTYVRRNFILNDIEIGRKGTTAIGGRRQPWDLQVSELSVWSLFFYRETETRLERSGNGKWDDWLVGTQFS